MVVIHTKLFALIFIGIVLMATFASACGDYDDDDGTANRTRRGQRAYNRRGRGNRGRNSRRGNFMSWDDW